MASSVMIVLALCASASAFRVPGGAAKAPLSASCATAFRVPGAAARPATALRSATITDEARALRADGLYAADRHVTTSRFLVPRDEQVAFEQSWVAKADALAGAPGLKYFQMSKYAADFMGPPLGDDEPNYHAYAVWESAEAAAQFDAAGGNPATYDGLFSLALPAAATGVPPPDRAIDPEKRLPREAFVASNRFGIKPGFEKQFEDMWAARASASNDRSGFLAGNVRKPDPVRPAQARLVARGPARLRQLHAPPPRGRRRRRQHLRQLHGLEGRPGLQQLARQRQL